ncbi:hypothetical protein [Vibrio cholerae]|uniref:hypothetical protein n=1 Tax=Vibrio cholerae TaxID=666 RepID=UPI003C700523
MRDYPQRHIRLFTIKQALRHDKAAASPYHRHAQLSIAEFVSKAAKEKLNTEESDTLAPCAWLDYAKSNRKPTGAGGEVSGATKRLHMVINIYTGSELLRPFIIIEAT